jgi:hypothetical protein
MYKEGEFMKNRFYRNILIAAVLLTLLSASSAFSLDPREVIKNVNGKEEEVFDSSRFQSGIKSDRSLGSVAKDQSFFGDPSVSFGFAAKSAEAKFFIIGSLYSEALAYLKSGNTDLAAKRIESIEKEFINLNVPDSLFSYISKTHNIVVTKRYSPEAEMDFLSLFQPLFEDYAKSKGEDKLTLFRAGSWLFDMGLTAAAGDKDLLKQSSKLNYFITEMKKMDAPKGVLDSLAEIEKISEKKEISDKDAADVLKLVKNIQTVLG